MISLAYALLAYAAAIGSLVWFGLALAGLAPSSLVEAPGGVPGALLVDLALLAVFAVQHSGMARQGYKRRARKVVRTPVERATYNLASAGVLSLIVAAWQPLPGVLWAAEGAAHTAVLALAALGWVVVFGVTYLIDHFELMGLKQAWAGLRRREAAAPGFVTPSLYRLVRHPMQLGMLIVLWAAPVLTLDRVVLAAGMTLYIVVGTTLEERDLVATFGATYLRYRERVPKLLPWPRPARDEAPAEALDAVVAD